jgi:type IV pilus assembly protein PilY1
MNMSGFPLAFAPKSGARAPYTRRLASTLLLLPAVWLAGVELAQAQWVLSQSPPVGRGREPAPNVILSLDDSGSMLWYAASDDPAPVGSRRIDLLRNALRNQFGDGTANSGRIKDGDIRLAWQAMNNTATTLAGGGVNSLRRFEGSHRLAFNNFVETLIANGGTPTHKLMKNVHDYMSTASGVESPFADNPGVTSGNPLQCRRTYHILLTDGGWNSSNLNAPLAGNADGIARRLPDGTDYDPNSAQTRAYRDGFGSNLGTVSDYAFLHWATDYAPSLANGVRSVIRKANNEVIVEDSKSLSLQPYWNPRNNPMTWQGVTTYTIGFGSSATQFKASAPTWDNTTDDSFGGTGYRRLMMDLQGWPDAMVGGSGAFDSNARTFEMWHAALNGRGKYYPARDVTALTNAFADILNNIYTDVTLKMGGVTASSASLRSDTRVYSTLYDTSNWSGDVRAHAISASSGQVSAEHAWSAATLLDARTEEQIGQRAVFTHNQTDGSKFEWNSLSDGQKADLRAGGTETLGQDRLNYLRGSRRLENATGGLRVRGSRLGSTVNSQPWFTPKRPSSGLRILAGYSKFVSDTVANRTDMLYVGASDGMLHGFDASTGRETLAYVPRGVYDHLAKYTNPLYTHRYLVDGNPFTADANFGSDTLPQWATVLVGSLGNGGKGYFLLDVTRPAAFSASNVLADLTDGSDADIGHMGFPLTRQDGDAALSNQVVRTNDGKWSVLLGNGVNSANSKPVLLVHRLDNTVSTGAALQKVGLAGDDAAYTGNGNGLSNPRAIDLDGNGTVDMAYAGDMQGNLLRFDLRSKTRSEWKASRVYRAVNTAGAGQPISAPPLALVHPKGGFQVVFGTGRNLTDTDASSDAKQTLYGIWDYAPFKTNNTESTVFFSGRGRLQQQQQVGDPKSQGGTTYFQTSDVVVGYEAGTGAGSGPSSSSKLGWYLDLPDAGYRTLVEPRVFKGGLVLFSTSLPLRLGSDDGSESCNVSNLQGGQGKLFVLSALEGRRPPSNVFGGLTGGVYSGATTLAPNLVFDKGKDDILVPPPPVCTDPNNCTNNSNPALTLNKGWTVPPIFGYIEN